MHPKLTPFPCTACGQCCRRVGNSELTASLDRGDGICQHFNESTHLCTIYDARPMVCWLEDYDRTHLTDEYRWDAFVALNVAVRRSLDADYDEMIKGQS